jgi:hypothetical protein
LKYNAFIGYVSEDEAQTIIYTISGSVLDFRFRPLASIRLPVTHLA